MKRLALAAFMAVFLWAGYAVADNAEAVFNCGPMVQQYKTALRKGQAFAGIGISQRGYALTLYAGKGGFTLFGHPDIDTACVLDTGPRWRWVIEYAI